MDTETEVPDADSDLHSRLCRWDRELPFTSPPSYRSLVEFLCRRLVSSSALSVVKNIAYYVIRCLLYMLGFESAHGRIEDQHIKDAHNSCWYCPAMADDRFGLRPDETYFQGASLPPQVQVSYAIVIRGTRHDPYTSILDGLGQHDHYGNEHRSYSVSNVVFPDRIVNEASSPMLHRAASLILAILKAREFYSGTEFSPDTYKGKPQTMQWYSFLFSTSIQFHRDYIERYKAPRHYSSHMMVMFRGRLYKVEILRRDVMGEEVMPTFEEIKRQLERIVQTSGHSSPPLHVSALTTLSAADRFKEEQRLKAVSETNKYNLATIRDSLFVTSLDPDDSPRFGNETLYMLQSKNMKNRWYDKSMNLVVFGNGVAGFVMNYLAGMTGSVTSAFVKLVTDKEEEILQSFLIEQIASHDQIKLKELKAPSLLSWDDTTDNYMSKKIQHIVRCREGSGPFVPLCPALFKLSCGLTSKSLIKLRVSPAGTVQAALQLALLRMRGRCMSVFEIISIRHYRLGGLAWMEINTADMKKFITAASEYMSEPSKDKHYLRCLLRRATQSYRDDVIRHKEGDVSLWHLDAIYRTLGLQTRLPRSRDKIRSLRTTFQQPIIDYLRQPSVNLLPPPVAENVTSNPGWNPAIEAVGRVGVKCLLSRGAMAMHYMFSNSSIAVTVSSSPDHPCYGKEKEFAKALCDAMEFIKELLDHEP